MSPRVNSYLTSANVIILLAMVRLGQSESYGDERFGLNCTRDDDCDEFQSCFVYSYGNSCYCSEGYEPDFPFEVLTCKGIHETICESNDNCLPEYLCYRTYPDNEWRCKCPNSQIYTGQRCREKVPLNGICSYKDQCVPDSECTLDFLTGYKTCQCKKGFKPDKRDEKCRKENDDSKTALQIYKITMIFASTVLGLILLIFLACILRKTYCPSQAQFYPPLDNSVPDIFTIFPGGSGPEQPPFNVHPPFEKPPTYDESQVMMRREMGIPPPAYPDTPSTLARPVNITTPSSGASSSATHSSSARSQEQSQQPSTSTSVQISPEGFENSAFDDQE